MDKEQILALAGDPVAMVCAGQVIWEGASKPEDMTQLYTADQVLAARKDLEQEVERNVTRRYELVACRKERDEIRQQLADAEAKAEHRESMCATLRNDINDMQKQLAAAQADNERLQKAFEEVKRYLSVGNATSAYNYIFVALAQPSETSALDALEAIVEKAGEVMRSRSAIACRGTPYSVIANEKIRALPGVTISDLAAVKEKP